MTIRSTFALFLIAACALSTGATAQNVYKCGNTYSQTPCPDAQTLQVDDKRTDAQKQASDRATVRDTNAARALELERLQKERAAQEAANVQAKAQAKADAARKQAESKPHAKTVAQQKKKKPANFSAMAVEKPADTATQKAKKAAKP